MQVQIVRASTRHRALAEARRLMGPDPLVLSVRRRPGGRGEEEWEAIVARETPEPYVALSREAKEQEGKEEMGSPPANGAANPWEELERFRSELADFRASLARGRAPSAQLLTLAHRLSRLEGELVASALRGRDLSEQWGPLVQRLEAAGYTKVEALRIVQNVDISDIDEPGPDWQQYHERIRQALTEGLEVAPAEERLDPGLVVFAGTAGVGKTTLAAKLAADLCLGGAARPTMGVVRPRKGVGLETVRRCASALGIEFIEVRSKETLVRLAEQAVNAPVILDTPAVNPLDETGMSDLRDLLSAAPSAEIHAVVSACFSDQDLSRAVDALSWAPKRRLSATHLDEAPYVGRIMSVAARSRVPIGYLSLGPRIPDDLARPALGSLVDSVLQAEGAFAS